MRLHRLASQAALALTIASFAARAELPANAIIADTPEKETLINMHLQEMLKATGHPEVDRGHWFVALPLDRRDVIFKKQTSLPPDKSDEYYTAEFLKAYNGFGADVATRPYCVFTALSSEPLVYGQGYYGAPMSRENSNSNLGHTQVDGHTFTNFDAKKMNGGYESMQAAYKKLGENGKIRMCYKFLRVAKITNTPPANFFNKEIIFEWLGGDVVDARTMQGVLNMPTSWAWLQ